MGKPEALMSQLQTIQSMTKSGRRRDNKIHNQSIYNKITPELPYYANSVLNIHNNGKYKKKNIPKFIKLKVLVSMYLVISMAPS